MQYQKQQGGISKNWGTLISTASMNELNPYMKNSIPTKFWKTALTSCRPSEDFTTKYNHSNSTCSFVHFASTKGRTQSKTFFPQLVSLHLNSKAINGVFW